MRSKRGILCDCIISLIFTSILAAINFKYFSIGSFEHSEDNVVVGLFSLMFFTLFLFFIRSLRKLAKYGSSNGAKWGLLVSIDSLVFIESFLVGLESANRNPALIEICFALVILSFLGGIYLYYLGEEWKNI